MAGDLLDGIGGEERPDMRVAADGFWKPEAPATIIGKLDRIEPGRKFGDFAVLTDAVVFRAGDNKPMFAVKEQGIPAGANLSGKLKPEDSGKFVAIAFTGWENQPGGKMRKFTVKVGVDEAKTVKLLAAARKKLGAADEAGDDDLPF